MKQQLTVKTVILSPKTVKLTISTQILCRNSSDASTNEVYWQSGTQDEYNRRTSTTELCKHVVVRAQQENKGSANNNKQKECNNDNNQTLYTTYTDRSTIPMFRALRQQFVLVVKLQPQKEF
jgi:hypothetical protein